MWMPYLTIFTNNDEIFRSLVKLQLVCLKGFFDL